MFLKSIKRPGKVAANQAPASRIRRHTPPPLPAAIAEPANRDGDALTVIVGILAFEMAILVIILGLAEYYV